MNHKRKKSRRSVGCTLCTPHRWRGNSAGRHKSKEEAATAVALREEPGKPHRSGPMNANQRTRSLRQRLAHLAMKRAEYARRDSRGWLMRRVLDDYDREIALCEKKLGQLSAEVV